MAKQIFMAVTRDELSLPLAVADSAQELAELRGVSANAVYKGLCRAKKKKYPGYIRVEVEEAQPEFLNAEKG